MDKLGSSPTPRVNVNTIMRKSQTRVWKILEGEPEFIISVAETQNVLDKFATSKMNFVILNVDLVASTKLSMTLPLVRLTIMIQAFNQEMSLIVKEFGGFVLKYVGDAVLAFFVVSGHQSQAKAACIQAINCARCMLQVAHGGINPILNQYNCPVINVRIGIDLGENAVIQSGWDIHPNIINLEKNSKNNNINKKEQPIIKKPVYDILGYTTSIAVKMTALANPNHMVIGQLVYDVLEDNQKSVFQQLGISPEIWSYVSNNTGGNIYNVYTNK
ncbi:MAG: adenylate/guanylate cyclase domain-containing protein [Nitrososphaeraceae archaeon]